MRHSAEFLVRASLSRCVRGRGPLRAGISLLEMAVVISVMGILIASAVPSFRRAFEQSRADIAGANLRAIWSAERIYWLDQHAFTSDMQELESRGLIDPAVIAGNAAYTFAVNSADESTFSAVATRIGSERWSGAFTIDQSGTVSGSVVAPGENSIHPGFE